MRELLIDVQGPSGLFAVFEEDQEQGVAYLYIYEPNGAGIIRHLRIYDLSPNIMPQPQDIEVVWSADYKKCGVAIWGRMQGIMDLTDGREVSVPIEGREAPGITDPEWLKGFENYLDQDQFIQARKKYWMEMIKQYEANTNPCGDDETSTETNFILNSNGPDKSRAIFEDDGATGYLYLYDLEEEKVLRHLHIYDRSENLNISPQDIQLMWSNNGKKCGVVIWKKMRGIIDQEDGEGRVWMENRDTPGIEDQKWLSGFTLWPNDYGSGR